MIIGHLSMWKCPSGSEGMMKSVILVSCLVAISLHTASAGNYRNIDTNPFPTVRLCSAQFRSWRIHRTSFAGSTYMLTTLPIRMSAKNPDKPLNSQDIRVLVFWACSLINSTYICVCVTLYYNIFTTTTTTHTLTHL